MDRLSEFLFARPSFLEGVARILDIGGTYDRYNSSRTPEEADANAIRADWMAVGGDVMHAAEQVKADSERESSSGQAQE